MYKCRNGNKKPETYEEETGIGFPHFGSGLVLHEFSDGTSSSVGPS